MDCVERCLSRAKREGDQDLGRDTEPCDPNE